jgi:hypothetical protein
MFKRTHTRREHFTAWLLCSSVAWLGGLGCVLANEASVVAIAAAASMSVIVAAALFYSDSNKPEYAYRIIFVLAHLHVLFFIGVIFFLGNFTQKFMKNSPTGNSVFYEGASFLWRMYWSWFILVTLVTLSLVVYWGKGKALQLK